MIACNFLGIYQMNSRLYFWPSTAVVSLMKLCWAKLRSAYRRDPIVAQDSSVSRIHNVRIVRRNADNYTPTRGVHQYACMLHDYDYSTTTGDGVEELKIEEVGWRIFERQWVYRATSQTLASLQIR